MGCCYSRLEKEEIVSRCKARKRYMKQFVKARHAFSASHCMYLRCLRTTGSALLQFATAETTLHHPPDHHLPPTLPTPPPPQPPTPPPPPPPPMSPTSETWKFRRVHSPAKGRKVQGYGKNLSPLFGSWSSNQKLNVFGCNGMGGVSAVGGSLGVGSHCSTVERLYAWEKKLYQEVKNMESSKIEHAKRVEQLRKMELKRADYMKTEKAKKEVEKLESIMMVSSQAIESTSDEIVKLREEELYPQLVELVKGLMGMWRNLYECHQVQMHIVQQLKYLHATQSTDPTSELHRQAGLQLELEVQQWHQSFCSLVKSQRDYVQSLTGWLRLSLFQIGKTALSHTKQDSPIYTLCEEWHLVVDNAPDNVASEGIKALLTAVHAIVVQQAEEQKQKKRADSSYKVLEKKMSVLRALERKFGPFSSSSNGKDQVGDKRAKVESLRAKTEEERGKYEKTIKVTRAMTLSNLQIGLPHVFQAVTGFANVWTHGFESVYNRAKRPEEVHDVKRLML
ncbi:hypothetical protein Hdeb2414_s0002g00065521 [Helianthus debilis subsp. tardiflorus]